MPLSFLFFLQFLLFFMFFFGAFLALGDDHRYPVGKTKIGCLCSFSFSLFFFSLSPWVWPWVGIGWRCIESTVFGDSWMGLLGSSCLLLGMLYIYIDWLWSGENEYSSSCSLKAFLSDVVYDADVLYVCMMK
ncbi:hypothetical protein V8C42DRAFT_300438 [Trichoderma barbatum]